MQGLQYQSFFFFFLKSLQFFLLCYTLSFFKKKDLQVGDFVHWKESLCISRSEIRCNFLVGKVNIKDIIFYMFCCYSLRSSTHSISGMLKLVLDRHMHCTANILMHWCVLFTHSNENILFFWPITSDSLCPISLLCGGISKRRSKCPSYVVSWLLSPAIASGVKRCFWLVPYLW